MADNQRYSLIFDLFSLMGGHTSYEVNGLHIGMLQWEVREYVKRYIYRQFGDIDFTLTLTKTVTDDVINSVEISISFPPSIVGMSLNNPSVRRMDNADVS